MTQRTRPLGVKIVWAGTTPDRTQAAIEHLANAGIGATIAPGPANARFGVFVVPRYERRARRALIGSPFEDGIVEGETVGLIEQLRPYRYVGISLAAGAVLAVAWFFLG